MDVSKKMKSTDLQNLVSEAIDHATERRKKGAEISDLSIDELEKIQGGLRPPYVTSGIISTNPL